MSLSALCLFNILNTITLGFRRIMEEDFPFDVIPHTVPVHPLRQYSQAVLDEQNDLFLSVKQYVPRQVTGTGLPSSDLTDPMTIVAAGGTGFFKELYEPLFTELLIRAQSVGLSIRAIWIADLVMTGLSAVENRSNLGCDSAWKDHAHDLLCMIQHFWKQMPRPLVALGHSMGCNQFVYLSHWHPRLFNSMAFIEPGLDAEYGKGIVFPWIWQALKRKDEWSTREEAEMNLVKSHVAAGWDNRTISRLKKYGVYRVADGSKEEWRSTTPGVQIAALVLRFNPHGIGKKSGETTDLTLEERESIPDLDPAAPDLGPFYRFELQGAWDLLPNVRPWILYVNGGNSPFFGRPSTRDERAKITGTGVGGNGGIKLGAVEQVIIKNGEHTMVFDNQMGEVAESVAQWLSKEAKRWDEGGKKALDAWKAKSLSEKQSVPKAYEEALLQQVKRSKKEKL